MLGMWDLNSAQAILVGSSTARLRPRGVFCLRPLCVTSGPVLGYSGYVSVFVHLNV